MKKLLVVMLLVLVAVPAQSQVRRRVSRVTEPQLWLTGSIGLFNGNEVSDGKTNSVWDFGRASVPQYRLALERSFNRNMSIGLTGTYMHAPFTYLGEGGVASCSRCGAHMDVVSAGASFHVGGGLGLHQVLETGRGVELSRRPFAAAERRKPRRKRRRHGRLRGGWSREKSGSD